MTKITKISNEMRDWILNTLQSGANPEAIVQAMIKKGFEPAFAFTVMIRILNHQKVNTIDGEKGIYEFEEPAIARKGNVIHTSDRDIHVLLKVEKPYVLYLDNVLSDEECEQLIDLSRDRLRPSEIYDPATGEKTIATGRTSKGAYFTLQENELVARIENRIAQITNHPFVNGENLQVLNYEMGEEYKAHFDYFPSNQVQRDKGGQRIATFLLYLNDVEAGGETLFPKINLSVVPKKGTALYFFYGNSKGQVDRLSLHSSIPVAKGEKWVSTKWIREGRIER